MEEVKPYNLCKCRECTGTGLGWLRHMSQKEQQERHDRLQREHNRRYVNNRKGYY
jgi:hypothetical protein